MLFEEVLLCLFSYHKILILLFIVGFDKYLDKLKGGICQETETKHFVATRPTLESGIDVGQGITVGPRKFVKKNKHRALNKRRA